MMLPCLVLGGGLGTRMRPETDLRPKPLLEVAGEPFVVHQLRWLASQGVTEVVYSIGYLGQLIRQALEPRHDLGVSLCFVDEGPSLLGTGGAVRLAVDEGAVAGSFFVLYGDSYLDLDLAAVRDAFVSGDGEALMTVFRNDHEFDKSNVVLEGDRVVRYDKTEADPRSAGMRHIDYGLSILTSDTAKSRLPRGRSDLADLFCALSHEGHLAGYEAAHRFFEIGSPRGLADLRSHLAAGPP